MLDERAHQEVLFRHQRAWMFRRIGEEENLLGWIKES